MKKIIYLILSMVSIAAYSATESAAPEKLTLFSDIMNFRTLNGTKTENNEIIFSVTGNPWGQIFEVMAGIMEDENAYLVEFDYKLDCEQLPENYIIIVVRDTEYKLSDFAISSVPTKIGEFRKGRVFFKTGKNAKRFAIMFHSHGTVKGVIKNLTVKKALDTTSFRSFADKPDAFNEDAIKKIPTGAKEFSVDLPQAKKEIVVSAADFGLTPNDTNAFVAINKALEHCKKIGATKLVIPQGIYKSYGDNAQIQLNDFEDFTIEGNNSTFIVNKSLRKNGSSTFSIVRNNRVLIKDINFDWAWDINPLASIVEIVAATDKSFDIKFVEYDKFPQNDVRIGLLSSYDPKTKSVGIEGGKTRAYNMFVGRGEIVKTEWISDNVLRVHAPHSFELGELYRLQHSYYEYGCVSMNSNTHLTLKNFNVYSCSGHAFVVVGTQQYWHFDNVNIVRPPNPARRAITTTADHLHIGQSRGYMLFENCDFSLGADDCINMHDCSIILSRESDRTLLSGSARNSYLYEVGEEIELRQDDFSPTGFVGKVIEKTLINKEKNIYRITLDKPIPEVTGIYFVIFSKKYDTRNIIVRNSVFHDNRARGILILARDVTIEKCRFFHNEMGAIKIETGFTSSIWCEGYGVDNVVIRDCNFDTCNPLGVKTNGYARDIYAGVYLFSDPSYEKTEYPILRDIMFENNTFKDTFGLTAIITSVQNFIFKNNTLIAETPRKNQLPYRGSFYVGWSKDVYIINNTYKSSSLFSNLGVYVEKGTVKHLKSNGNKVE